MTSLRLAHALDTGAFGFPENAKAVFLEPAPDMNLSGFGLASIVIQQSFKPAFDHFTELGLPTTVHADGPVDIVHITLPRSRELARGLIAAATVVARADGGTILVDGAKTDGIDSILKAVKARVDLDGQVSKAHGKLFWFQTADKFADWTLPGPASVADGWFTQPGIFSADGPDAGSEILVKSLPSTLKGHGADLGGGWGYLTKHLLAQPKVTHVDLVEADKRALDCAQRNVDDPRVTFQWADATTWGTADSLDWVVMNPPFHVSRTPDVKLGQAFIASAARLLTPKGQLVMVANRHLPYEAALAANFVHVQELDGDARFKILQADQPISPKRAARIRKR